MSTLFPGLFLSWSFLSPLLKSFWKSGNFISRRGAAPPVYKVKIKTVAEKMELGYNPSYEDQP